jgi:hypothetical protein
MQIRSITALSEGLDHGTFHVLLMDVNKAVRKSTVLKNQYLAAHKKIIVMRSNQMKR